MVYNIKYIQNKVFSPKKWYFLAKNDDFYEKSAIFLKHEKFI